MNEPKFTPGPWRADWQKHPVLFPFVFQEHGYAVAKLCGEPLTPNRIVCNERDFAAPEKVKANAALIAAAPEMYEALADIAENCGNRGCSETCAEAGCKICKILKKVRGKC